MEDYKFQGSSSCIKEEMYTIISTITAISIQYTLSVVMLATNLRLIFILWTLKEQVVMAV